MALGNHATGSAMSVMTQKKAKSAGLRRRRTKRRSVVLKATVENLKAMMSKKRAKTERMKKRLNRMIAEAEEKMSECARMREQNKLAIEENADIQLSVDYMVRAFFFGGNGGG